MGRSCPPFAPKVTTRIYKTAPTISLGRATTNAERVCLTDDSRLEYSCTDDLNDGGFAGFLIREKVRINQAIRLLVTENNHRTGCANCACSRQGEAIFAPSEQVGSS